MFLFLSHFFHTSPTGVCDFEMQKLMNRSQLNRVRRPEEGALTACYSNRAQQEEESSSSFLARTQLVKSQRLVVFPTLFSSL